MAAKLFRDVRKARRFDRIVLRAAKRRGLVVAQMIVPPNEDVLRIPVLAGALWYPRAVYVHGLEVVGNAGSAPRLASIAVGRMDSLIIHLERQEAA